MISCLQTQQRIYSLLFIALSILMVGVLAGCSAASSSETDVGAGEEAAPLAAGETTEEAEEDAEEATEGVAEEAEEEAQPAAQPTMMELVIAQTRHFKGAPDAPITIIEFSDFQCPYCGKFGVETAPKIDENYVETGKVRVGYRHTPYQGEGSLLAAEASECAAEQEAFWPYHDRLVERLAVEGKRDFSAENLKAFAAEIDSAEEGVEIDSEQFNQCLDERKYSEMVMAELENSHSILGVSGTPTFLINGTRLVGAQPYEAFEQVIESHLNGAE